MLKKVSVRFWLICGWNLNFLLHQAATLYQPHPQFERKLGEFFKHQIESDISPVYGDGFRAGQKAVRKYGLQRTLHHIRMTGTFPY